MSHRSLLTGFLKSAALSPDRTALEIDSRVYSYSELAREGAAIAASLSKNSGGTVALLAERSLSAYAGMLGILGSGNAYTPLVRSIPTARALKMCLLARVQTFVVGEQGKGKLLELLPSLPAETAFLFPEGDVPSELSGRKALGRAELSKGGRELREPPSNALAYILFTSGSTGEPKGIRVAHASAASYVDFALKEYAPRPGDRFSQFFDLTFDPSVHDCFVAWGAGAELVVFPERYRMAHTRFIQEKKITHWYSVPSVILGCLRMGMLKIGCLPSLKVSLFVGEALPAGWADAWQKAAPGSRVDNVYGPTETTVTVSRYTWDPAKSPAECENGIVPIGRVHETQSYRIADESGAQLPRGKEGELWIAGSQVALGYLNDPERENLQFVTKEEKRWYRTGDLVRETSPGLLQFLGRVDFQVKVHGFRVELQEVDYVVRRLSNAAHVVTVAYPVMNGSAGGLYSFVCGADKKVSERFLRDACRGELPPYMVPDRFFLVGNLPTNANGKVDRAALTREVEGLVETGDKARA